MPLKHFVSLSLILLVGIAPAFLHAAGDADDFYEMKVGGDKMLTILESLPYASEGNGPTMYFFEYTECPYCQAMYRDFNGKDVGIEFRRMFFPVSNRTAAETAALGKSRDINDYHAFMEGRKRAPAFDKDNEAIKAYNAIITAGTKELPRILKQNGWPLEGFTFPQYFWVENGRVFANAGYTKPSLERAIQRVKEGNQKSAKGAKIISKSQNKTKSHNAKLQNAVVGGIKLGMTPEQVEKIFSGSPKKYKVGINNLSVHGNNFVGSITASLDDFMVIKSLGGGASDFLSVEFAPPPHENIVVAVSRNRRFGLNEQAPPHKVEAAIFDKYGPPDHRPKDISGVTDRYVWRDRPSACDATGKRDGPAVGDIYRNANARRFRDGSANCPVFMFIKKRNGRNIKTNKYDYVYSMDTILADFPTIVESNRELSEVTRNINERESLERAKKSVPTDL